MNWIILINARLFELVFAICVDKAKESIGNEMKCIYDILVFFSPYQPIWYF